MIFQSLDFLVFLAIVFVVYWSVPKKLRNVTLLAASYIFYGYVHPWFLLLLWFVTLAVYGCGIAMQALPRHRRLFLIVGLTSCLGLLGIFKYLNFFLDNVVSALRSLGLDVSPVILSIALPVGISFFAFQGMSYVIDVFRGSIVPRRNLVDIALFKAFFPQLVAGPIERATHFLPQIEADRALTPDRLMQGLMLMMWGFFKKLVIADNVSVIASKIFMLENPGFPLLWAGVLAFCIQIYADFSGYTDIARGTAKLFGFDLMMNFRHPYLATSPVDFWRRWHISLSTWLRDYVYIPLGGNRGNRVFAARNVMATFLLSGLWHGASWNYVLWGGYWGALTVAQNNLPFPRLPTWLKVPGMFVLTNVGWLMFRETDFHYLSRYLSLKPWDASSLEWQAAGYFTMLVVIYSMPLAFHAWWDMRRDTGTRAGVPAYDLPIVSQGALATLLFAAILLLRTAATADFIYFKF